MLSKILGRSFLKSKESPIEKNLSLHQIFSSYLQVHILVKLMYLYHGFQFFINASDYIFFVSIKEVKLLMYLFKLQPLYDIYL